MKTLKTLTAAVLMVVSMSAFAANEPANAKLQMEFPIKTYIDAMVHGQLKGIANVLDNDVKLTFTRGEKIMNYGKSDILASLKATKNTEQNCSTDYSIVEQTSTQAMVKVTMKYDGFSRVNFITLANTTKGWKITNVSSSFN